MQKYAKKSVKCEKFKKMWGLAQKNEREIVLMLSEQFPSIQEV